jgi:capsular polysaccharide biosynthesis protein
MMGLGCGFGMAFLREQMDHSFRDAEDLETTLGLKVLANVPRVEKMAA